MNDLAGVASNQLARRISEKALACGRCVAETSVLSEARDNIRSVVGQQPVTLLAPPQFLLDALALGNIGIGPHNAASFEGQRANLQHCSVRARAFIDVPSLAADEGANPGAHFWRNRLEFTTLALIGEDLGRGR